MTLRPPPGSEIWPLANSICKTTPPDSVPQQPFVDESRENEGTGHDTQSAGRFDQKSDCRQNLGTTTHQRSVPKSRSPAPASIYSQTTDSVFDHNQRVQPIGSANEITTQWGGVFYLVNVALALGYYGDFTSPLITGLDLPLWDFLELFGHRFAGPTFMKDPLTLLLRQLSGRSPGEAPGAHFDPPAGLSMEAWLVETENHLRTRLEAALGTISADSLRAFVFQHRARVCATATRIDVTYSLSEHPIELRLAGLDRDPGWIPAGGRILAFHYE